MKTMHEIADVATGNWRGIGREIALLMGEHGAKVLVTYAGVSVSGDGASYSPGKVVVFSWEPI